MKTKDSKRPIAIIDIDGTIAKVGHRGQYLEQCPIDWNAFYNDSFDDEPIRNVCYFVKLLQKECDIFFCTSRREVVRDKTQQWLKNHLGMEPSDYELIMRQAGDDRPDYISKIDNFIIHTTQEERSRVKFVIEDSMTVAWHWRQQGFTTYKVS